MNLFLQPFTKRAQSVRTRTDTTLDQDCVLKATVQVCTACMIVSLLTTCMNFNTPPLAQVAPFRCKIRESNAEVTLDTKLSKHVCQLILVKPGQLHLDHSRVSKRSPRLVYKHKHGPDKASALSVILARHWAFKCSSPILPWRQSVHKISYCLLLLLCYCFAHCCHDPFLVRSASNFSTASWFHSVCASDSMFTITDNCLFLFLFLFLFLDRYLNTTRASVQTSRPLHLHRSKPLRVHTKSVYVRTKSADSAPVPSSACYHHLAVECGIHGL